MRSHFGKQLKAAREARGYTQKALGDMIGLDPNTVARIERGSQGMRWGNMETLIDLLAVSPSYFFTNESPPKTESPPLTIKALTQIIEQQENRLKERENTITLEAVLNRLGKHARRIVEQTIKDDLGIKDLKELVQNSDRQIDDRT